MPPDKDYSSLGNQQDNHRKAVRIKLDRIAGYLVWVQFNTAICAALLLAILFVLARAGF